MFNWRICLGFGCLILLMLEKDRISGKPPTSTVPGVSDIRDCYRKQKENLQELSVKWVMKNELHVNAAIAAKIDETTDYFICEVQAAFKGSKRFYDERFRRTSGRKDTIEGLNRSATAYDGQTTQYYKGYWNPRPKHPNWARIYPGDALDECTVADDYMASHGMPKCHFDMPVPVPKSVPLDLAALLKEDVYQVEPALQPATDGTPCVLVKSKQERIWFDPKLNLALRQREWLDTVSSRVIYRIRLADHVECIPGIWLAKTIYRDYFCDPREYPVPVGQPYRTEAIRVTELKADSVLDSLFRLKLGPRTFIEDLTRIPANADGSIPTVTYKIPTDPGNLDQIIQRATDARTKIGRPYAQRAKSRRWLLFVNLAAVCVIGAYWLYRTYRRYKQRRTTDSTGAGSTS